MPADRFDKLEGDNPLPGAVKEALSNLGRFDHLEIGTRPPSAPAAALSPGKEIPQPEKLLCLHCGQANEKERSTCWACFQPLRGPVAKPAHKGPEDVTIVLDGINYKSSDPNLPPDVKELMRRITEQGFSQELLAGWRNWRASRNEPPTGEPLVADAKLVPVENVGKDPLTGNEVFKGQRSAVIRLDGKIYTSTDMELTPEIRELFRYIEAHGVTPALMEHLRQVGKKATVVPATTAAPSVEDLAFWDHAQQTQQQQQPLSDPPEQQGATFQDPADAGRRMTTGVVIIAAVILYVIIRALSGNH